MVTDPESLEQTFRQSHGRILALLIRGTGSFDIAEDALQDAFVTAAERWPVDGVPSNPAAWIFTAARRKALDRLRRATVYRRKAVEAAIIGRLEGEEIKMDVTSAIPDERLRLIFTCCHPALALEARVALSLRTLCGLSTPEIARAFLVPEATMAQRIVRAKRKIREERIPYEVPADHDMVERLDGVLAVVYLVFNEGYAATLGPELTRASLCAEAVRLGRVLAELMPDEPEVLGLLALMLLQDSRRKARTSAAGDLVTLEEQDRTLWDEGAIAQGQQLTERSLRMGRPGPYQVQAAIAALHGEAKTPAETDWAQIVLLYDVLLSLTPGPVIELNRAAAVAMATGPNAGLELMDAAHLAGQLEGFPLYHSARADLHRRAGRPREAAAAYRRALELVSNGAQRAYLERRLRELSPLTVEPVHDL